MGGKKHLTFQPTILTLNDYSYNCLRTIFVMRTESSGGMEWLGVWICFLGGSEFFTFGA